MITIKGDSREYKNFKHYANIKYREHYLNAIEKMALQSFRDDLVLAYALTEEEKKAVLYLNNGETRILGKRG